MIFVKSYRGGREVNMINTMSKINLSIIEWEGGGSTSIWIMSLNILCFFLTLPLRHPPPPTIGTFRWRWMSSYNVPRLHLMKPIDFWCNYTPFLGAAAFCTTNIQKTTKPITLNLILAFFLVHFAWGPEYKQAFNFDIREPSNPVPIMVKSILNKIIFSTLMEVGM